MIDSLLALSLILTAVTMIPLLQTTSQEVSSKIFVAQDLINVLSILPVKYINTTFVNQSINSGKISNPNASVLEQIGNFWAENATEDAKNLTIGVLSDLLSSEESYSFLINGEQIYMKNLSEKTLLIASRRIASGFQKGKPVFGFSSKVSLKGISGRKTSSYAYFGGFIGEGNITARMDLPQNLTKILGGALELDAGSDFQLFINNNFVGDYFKETGNGTYGIPDKWVLNSSQTAYFVAGINTVEIKFKGLHANSSGPGPSYIAGGLIRVDYETSNIEDLQTTYSQNGSLATSKYYFAGIDGFINIYDSIYIPGNLTSLKMYLDYDHPYTLYVMLGNATIFEKNSSGPETQTILNSTISQAIKDAGMTFSDLSEKTVPLRVGFRNVSRVAAPLDSFLVSDVSGSMSWKLINNENGIERTCDDPNIDNSDTQRLSAAKCASKEFIDSVLINEGPLLGLISYDTSTSSVYDLTNDSSGLKNEIDSYSPGGATCICCGVNSAVDKLNNNTNFFFVPRMTSGWKYLDTNPGSPGNWYNIGFDDSSWTTGTSAFGNGFYSGSVNTVVASITGYYYYRKSFQFSNTTNITNLLLYISSDETSSDAYLNGVLIDQDPNIHFASYWNRVVSINSSLLRNGSNVLSIRVYNYGLWGFSTSTFLEAELVGSASSNITSSRKKAIIVMSDGAANVECARQATGDAKNDAIQSACDAFKDNNILVYTVGFGPNADQSTLKDMATCGNGKYFNSTDSSSLAQAYKDIVDELLVFTKTQKANFSGESLTHLSENSYIEYEYVPQSPKISFGKIPLTIESNTFNNNISSGILNIPSQYEVTKVTGISYSADRWTDIVTLQNSQGTKTIYNLSKFSSQYHLVGDPYRVSISPSLIKKDEDNTITIRTGIGPNNNTGGSPSNKLIYELRISSIVNFGGAFFTNEGCLWNITYEDLTSEIIPFPTGYNGSRYCNYAQSDYDPNNAMDDAANRLFSQLDFNGNGKLIIKFNENLIQIETATIGEVPTLWGPAIMEIQLW